ncbi:hypothetical protein V8E36_000830, partial [Tilletia maclaganii]
MTSVPSAVPPWPLVRPWPVGMLETSFPNTGARVMLFVAGPPTEGPGHVVSTELRERIRYHHDIDKDNVKYFKRPSKFYDAIAKRAAKIFEKDDDGLLNVGFNATLDVQCRTEIKVSGLIGHAVSANKKSASVGETEIGISQTLAWKLCSISPKTAVGIYFEVVTPGDTPLQPGSRGLIKKRTPIPDSASPNLLHEGCQPINKRTGVHSHPAMKRQLQTGGEGDVVAESAGAPTHPHRAPGGLSSQDSPMFIALTADDAFQTPADTRSTRSMASSNNARRCPTAVCTSLSYTNYLSSPCPSRPDFQPDDEHRRRHRHLDYWRPLHGFQQQPALSATRVRRNLCGSGPGADRRGCLAGAL